MSNAPSNKVNPGSSAENPAVKIIECPRDAMQGIHNFIDTDIKVAYLNKLLKVGFDTIDFGSFVSPKAIPQLRDTAEVLSKLELNDTSSKLLAIVANLKGVQEAATHQEITYLGFPFSISETFQQRNTNASITQSFDTVKQMLEICDRANKEAVVYLSMGFGNPYGDEWSPAIVTDWAGKLVEAGVTILSLSDTTGVSSPEKIRSLVPVLFEVFRHHPQVEIGLHLHSTPETRLEKIDAAYELGCRRFDSAIKGYGGCPMAADDLTGNLATEELIQYLNGKGAAMQLNITRWQEALAYSSRVFL
ncbi:hydroxymethylglutaryl-CoA lyase like protein [Pedobacter sp. BAL39]|uniref:hydroxymethylglutaryl-CoA lyase n=1 Tax=Pedobacter sp. BAL39 TaxID=391596 RepID=UPI0001559B42|nr:hydroxymethylglutaryl-CoA lyase [Pedobacter sp. BAL39]EDM35259.1 hydroxymethylglutaryl-CoA lyase like protein [Pedobacter sp. BAL39]